MPKLPIKWDKKARLLKESDICQGTGRLKEKRDLRGWIIYFFGEHTRPAVAFEQHFSIKVGIRSHQLEIWSENVTIKEQVKLFNEVLKELKVLKKTRARNKTYVFHKIFKDGKIAKGVTAEIRAATQQKAWEKFGEKRTKFQIYEV